MNLHFRVLHKKDVIHNNKYTAYKYAKKKIMIWIYHFFFSVLAKVSKIVKLILGLIFNNVVLLYAIFLFSTNVTLS